MTTTAAQFAFGGSYHNYSLVFNSSSASVFSFLNLSCSSADPYYPGFGADFYIPCDPPNSSSNVGSVLIVDFSTDKVVGQIPLRGFYTSWTAPEGLAWDSANGLLYACNWNLGTLLALNTTARSLVFNATIPGGCSWVVYDPSANDLLVSGASPLLYGDGLHIVDPQTGTAVATPSTEGVTAGTVDSVAGWTALGAASSGNSLQGSVTFVNSSTLDSISTVTLSAPSGTGFGVPVQMLLDPAHGDLYVITSGNVFAINYSSHEVLADIGIPASNIGLFSSIYLASTDSLYVPLGGDILTVSLTHLTQSQLTSFLWLPAYEGILGLGVLAGAVLAVVAHTRRSRGRKVPDPARIQPTIEKATEELDTGKRPGP
ncbi:MAG: hypothetical protein L3K14_02815 [Thermoplasmata archaeon]|nr:hypothetical protein [Thermoplasmata archaeon]